MEAVLASFATIALSRVIHRLIILFLADDTMLPHYNDAEILELGLRPFGYILNDMEPDAALEKFRLIFGTRPGYFGEVWDYVCEEEFPGLRIEHILYNKMCHRLFSYPVGSSGAAHLMVDMVNASATMTQYYNRVCLGRTCSEDSDLVEDAENHDHNIGENVDNEEEGRNELEQ